MSTRRIPPVGIVHGQTLPELKEVATNPPLREAVWAVLRAEGFTDEQIQFNEAGKGRHTSRCIESTEKPCVNVEGEPTHRILDRYNEVESIIRSSGLLSPKPEGFHVGQVILDAAVLDELPWGTIIMGGKDLGNPDYQELFRCSGSKDRPWLSLDPSDRDDGENTEASGTILRWRMDGKAVVLHLPKV